MKSSLNIIVTSNSQTAYYSSSRLEAHLLINDNLGIYENSFKPNSLTIFSFMSGMASNEYIKSIDFSEISEKGFLYINYDTKEISCTDKIINPFKIMNTWIFSCFKGYEAYIESKSILNHIKNGRIYYIKEDKIFECTNKIENFMDENKDVKDFFYIKKPDYWKYVDS